MPTQKLEKLLQELEEQIENEALESDDLKRQLKDLKGSIERSIAGQKDDEPETLVESAMDALREFEDAHPTLTMTLGRIMDSEFKSTYRTATGRGGESYDSKLVDPSYQILKAEEERQKQFTSETGFLAPENPGMYQKWEEAAMKKRIAAFQVALKGEGEFVRDIELDARRGMIAHLGPLQDMVTIFSNTGIGPANMWEMLSPMMQGYKDGAIEIFEQKADMLGWDVTSDKYKQHKTNLIADIDRNMKIVQDSLEAPRVSNERLLSQLETEMGLANLAATMGIRGGFKMQDLLTAAMGTKEEFALTIQAMEKSGKLPKGAKELLSQENLTKMFYSMMQHQNEFSRDRRTTPDASMYSAMSHDLKNFFLLTTVDAVAKTPDAPPAVKERAIETALTKLEEENPNMTLDVAESLLDTAAGFEIATSPQSQGRVLQTLDPHFTNAKNTLAGQLAQDNFLVKASDGYVVVDREGDIVNLETTKDINRLDRLIRRHNWLQQKRGDVFNEFFKQLNKPIINAEQYRIADFTGVGRMDMELSGALGDKPTLPPQDWVQRFIPEKEMELRKPLPKPRGGKGLGAPSYIKDAPDFPQGIYGGEGHPLRNLGKILVGDERESAIGQDIEDWSDWRRK